MSRPYKAFNPKEKITKQWFELISGFATTSAPGMNEVE